MLAHRAISPLYPHPTTVLDVIYHFPITENGSLGLLQQPPPLNIAWHCVSPLLYIHNYLCYFLFKSSLYSQISCVTFYLNHHLVLISFNNVNIACN